VRAGLTHRSVRVVPSGGIDLNHTGHFREPADGRILTTATPCRANPLRGCPNAALVCVAGAATLSGHDMAQEDQVQHGRLRMRLKRCCCPLEPSPEWWTADHRWANWRALVE